MVVDAQGFALHEVAPHAVRGRVQQLRFSCLLRAGAAAAGKPQVAGTAGSAANSAGPCSRDALLKAMDEVLAALSAHDATRVRLSTSVRYTENTLDRELDEGLWRSAGPAVFQRTAVDSERCNAVAEVALSEPAMTNGIGTGTILSLRLALAADGVSELEANTAQGVAIFPTAGTGTQLGLASLAPDNAEWQSELPAAEQNTRAELEHVADLYLQSLGEAAEVPIGSPCKQQFNGAVLDMCETVPAPPAISGGPTTHRRVVVTDPQTGTVAAYGLSVSNTLTFVLLTVKAGKLRFIDAAFGAGASSTGWD